MPLKLSEKIGECYRLAAEAREKSSAHADPVIRQAYLDMEQRLLLLAHRERLTAFTAAKPRGRKRG
jgi:hypothetical protein